VAWNASILAKPSIEVSIAGDGPPLLFLHGIDYFAQHKPFLDLLARRFGSSRRAIPGFGAIRGGLGCGLSATSPISISTDRPAGARRRDTGRSLVWGWWRWS